MKPRLLDLFCGAGGAAMGYHRAGFDVVGVDIAPQPHYPFEFHQGDATTWPLDGFDAIHASPPCQAYSRMNNIIKDRTHPRLVDGTRERLAAVGVPFAIENVEGAPLKNAFTLCGGALGLKVRRHRLFEIFPIPAVLMAPCTCRSAVVNGQLLGVRLTGRRNGRMAPPATGSDLRSAMGCEWMTVNEAGQAIPPAYTEWVGAQLLAAVKAAAR